MLSRSRWETVGPPATPEEEAALELVRKALPDSPLIRGWTNVSFQDQRGDSAEVDVVLVTAQGIVLIELKGWSGRLDVSMGNWKQSWPGKSPRTQPDPVALNEMKCRRLKTVLDRYCRDERLAHPPYVWSVVVLHSRGSRVELSAATTARICALDGAGVTGNLPTLSSTLQEDFGRGQLTKSDVDRTVALLRDLGVVHQPARREPPAGATALAPALVPAQPTGPPTATVPDSAPLPLFDELDAEQLAALGVAAEHVELVRSASDLVDLMGVLDDAVWDDLERVAGGALIAQVLDDREALRQRHQEVARQAAAAQSVPSTQPLPSTQPGPAAHAQPEPVGVAIALPAQPKPHEESRLPVETLVQVARTEAQAGRLDAARALNARVRELVLARTLDLSQEELALIVEGLRAHPAARHRLRTGTPAGRVPSRSLAVAPRVPDLGQLWPSPVGGKSFSLLLRMDDVLDRSSGLFLSQVIGAERATQVVRRLRQVRPDGGRLRLASDGVLVSRMPDSDHHFVVGQVGPDEWFPAW